MGSKMRKTAMLLVVLMLFLVVGVVVYANWERLNKNTSATVEEVNNAEDEKAIVVEQIGSDTRAFLSDDTFFEPEKKPYSSIEKMEENRLSLVMTSVQKDLRIQVLNSQGKLVTGKPFTVVLNKDKEYLDENEDGIIYIEFLRAGEYQVELKEVEGYKVPEAPTSITVRQSVEYAVIDDISLLMFTEEDVDPALEDKEVKDALSDADKSEIKQLKSSNPNAKTGIDVSKWNGDIDWDLAKQAGVEFAIIRAGYRGAATGVLVKDPYFEQNMKGAARAGIPVGVYFFTQAVDVVEAVEEASMVVSLIKDYDITYPVFIDTESAGGSGRADVMDGETRTAVCSAFCATIENEGYRAGVYGSRNWFNQKLAIDRLKDYILWLAEYRDVPLYQGYYHMWQYSSQGSVDGIEGKVDLNLSYLKLGNEETPEAVTEAEAAGDEEAPEAETMDLQDGQGQKVVEPKPIEGADSADW